MFNMNEKNDCKRLRRRRDVQNIEGTLWNKREAQKPIVKPLWSALIVVT